MFNESEFSILIAGAGPTGLTVAVELARRRVPFRLVEMSEQPFHGSRGKGLQPRTQEVLDDLGVIDRFRTSGGDYPELLIHRPDGESMTWRMDERYEPTPSVPYPNVLMVPQWRTGELLAERLAELGGRIELGVGVTGLTSEEQGVSVTLSTGETARFRYVVGADGGRSTIRRALGVGFEGDTYETHRVLIADVRLTGLDRDHWHVWPGAERGSFRLGLCPLPGTEDFQLTAPQPDSDETSVEALQKLVTSVQPGVTLTHIGWTSMFRANVRMVDRYRVGNVFLAGDAAHVHSPAGGQGLNTGVQDAYNLGWKLASGSDALLDTYEAERLPVAAGVLGISTRLHQQHTERTEEAMRRDDPALRQLSLTYRGGPLASERRAAPGSVQAGDRAPDGPCGDTRIFDLLRGPHWTLLAFHAAGLELPPSTPDLHVHHVPDSAAQSYDVTTPTLFLIRPDNYIATATDAPEIPAPAHLPAVGRTSSADQLTPARRSASAYLHKVSTSPPRIQLTIPLR